MTYKVLVDVNIFEDVIRKRHGWIDSKKILNLIQNNQIDGWISSLTKIILYFLSVKKLGEKKAREFVEHHTRSFSEIPLRRFVNKMAVLSKLQEYEDNIQLESAKQFHLDCIITRNKKQRLG